MWLGVAAVSRCGYAKARGAGEPRRDPNHAGVCRRESVV